MKLMQVPMFKIVSSCLLYTKPIANEIPNNRSVKTQQTHDFHIHRKDLRLLKYLEEFNIVLKA